MEDFPLFTKQSSTIATPFCLRLSAAHNFGRSTLSKVVRILGIAALPAILLSLSLSPAAIASTGTTFDKTIGDFDGNNRLEYGAGEGYTVREELADANPNRENTRRRVFSPIIQLSDFQLVDEESPARLEGIDAIGGEVDVNGAYRPQESLVSQTVDAAVRSVNKVKSPVTRRTPKLTLVTGDNADSQQQNETDLYIDILNGGTVDPNSGDPTYKPGPCGDWPFEYPTDLYQGVRGNNKWYEPDGSGDGDGYSSSESENFNETGRRVASRDFPGLFDKANTAFIAKGLRSKWLTVFGNHDALWQGNFTFTPVSPTGCLKDLDGNLVPTDVVEPDRKRKLLSHQEWIDAHLKDGDGHGFSADRPDTGYYSVKKKNGLRLIGLDSVNLDGLSNGTIRDGTRGEPDQFGWLDSELTAADRAGETVIVLAHHSLETMNNVDWDGYEDQHCGLIDQDGEPPGAPQCEDLGNESLEALFYRHPSAVAYVSGHEHNNRITPRKQDGGPGSFWEMVLASENDWPQQSGMLEVFDNRDGTFSIFRTVIDHSGIPDPGEDPDLDNPRKLASISREISFNDPQGQTGENGTDDARGTITDRNVELIIEK